MMLVIFLTVILALVTFVVVSALLEISPMLVPVFVVGMLLMFVSGWLVLPLVIGAGILAGISLLLYPVIKAIAKKRLVYIDPNVRGGGGLCFARPLGYALVFLCVAWASVGMAHLYFGWKW